MLAAVCSASFSMSSIRKMATSVGHVLSVRLVGEPEFPATRKARPKAYPIPKKIKMTSATTIATSAIIAMTLGGPPSFTARSPSARRER